MRSIRHQADCVELLKRAADGHGAHLERGRKRVDSKAFAGREFAGDDRVVQHRIRTLGERAISVPRTERPQPPASYVLPSPVQSGRHLIKYIIRTPRSDPVPLGRWSVPSDVKDRGSEVRVCPGRTAPPRRALPRAALVPRCCRSLRPHRRSTARQRQESPYCSIAYPRSPQASSRCAGRGTSPG
jgi:hypothetical protein